LGASNVTDLTQLQAKAARLLALHKPGDPLILANVADAGAAKIVAGAGMKAVGTSSGGVAWALGKADGEQISRDEMIGLVGGIAAAVDLPVTADLEAGYGDAPEDVATTVRAALAAGIVGLNLEDGARSTPPIRTMEDMAARLGAARAAATEVGVPMVINARVDVFLRRIYGDDVDVAYEDAVARAAAYAQSGADCIFVPGVVDADLIGRLVAAIDAPVNVLANTKSPPIPVLAKLGVARVSIGGLLQQVAATAVRDAVEELTGPGTYSFGEGSLSHPAVNQLIAE